MSLDSHIHEWEVTATEIGDTLATCKCGAERLMTGTVVRTRQRGDDGWETPYRWNPEFYGRRHREQESG